MTKVCKCIHKVESLLQIASLCPLNSERPHSGCRPTLIFNYVYNPFSEAVTGTPASSSDYLPVHQHLTIHNLNLLLLLGPASRRHVVVLGRGAEAGDLFSGFTLWMRSRLRFAAFMIVGFRILRVFALS